MSVFARTLTLSPPIRLRLYTLPYWCNPLFLIFDIRALWRSVLSARAPECQKLKMVGCTQYGAEPFERQQFGTSGVESVKYLQIVSYVLPASGKSRQMPSTVRKRAHVRYTREMDVLRFQTRLQKTTRQTLHILSAFYGDCT